MRFVFYFGNVIFEGMRRVDSSKILNISFSCGGWINSINPKPADTFCGEIEEFDIGLLVFICSNISIALAGFV